MPMGMERAGKAPMGMAGAAIRRLDTEACERLGERIGAQLCRAAAAGRQLGQADGRRGRG